jgi:DUF4097 and DUF4098 domain-containing protein YvlB
MKRPVVITLLIVALALVCVGIGSVVYFANGFTVNNPFDVMQISSQLEESKTLEVDLEKPVSLKIEDDSGAVTVTGGDVETVQVEVVKTAYDSTQSRADAEVKTVKYTIQQTGNNITLKYALPKSVNFNNRVNSVDFIVTVPRQTNVNVDNNMGDVNITDIEGSVITESDFGEVSIDNVEGAVSASTNSGAVTATSIRAGSENIDLSSEFGTITLEKANGKEISLDTNSGAVELNEVRATGTLTASTEFGDVTIENGSADSLTVDTNSGGVSLTKLTVKKEIHVEDEFGNIELDQAQAASYDLNTNSGGITIDGAKGKLAAFTEFGNIDITNAESVTLDLRTNSGTIAFNGSLGAGPHAVRSEFGAVDLTLPADIQLDVDLSTEFGKIRSDLPISVTVTETTDSNSDQIVGSINDGGDLLTVETNNGSVTIHAGE